MVLFYRFGAEAAIGIYGNRLHPSCDLLGGNHNEMSRHRWIFLRRYLRGNDERSKSIGLHSDELVG